MDAKSLISVRNRNNGFTGYSIPDKGIWRNFAPGEIKKISLEELQQLQYQPGGEYTLNNLLVVQDASALEYLNMQVEPEYNYTEKDIKNLLLNGSLDQLKDFLDFAPEGAIEIAKEIAVNEEIPDIRKRDVISEATGFNINNAINVNHAMAEDDEPKQEESTKTRRTEPMNAENTKTRRSTPMTGSSTLPNYKVINQK
jgi:hypothetical protein